MMPGRLGLKIGLASNSPSEWVIGHLTRLGLLDYFDCISARQMMSSTSSLTLSFTWLCCKP